MVDTAMPVVGGDDLRDGVQSTKMQFAGRVGR